MFNGKSKIAIIYMVIEKWLQPVLEQWGKGISCLVSGGVETKMFDLINRIVKVILSV